MTQTLPPYTRIFGPISARRVFRLAVLYLGIAGFGLALAYVSGNDRLAAFGLGLALPGGGFLGHAGIDTASGLWHLAATVAATGLFGIALGLWFGTGNIVAPPAAWLGCAGIAAAMPPGMVHMSNPTIVPQIIACLALGLAIVTFARFIWAKECRSRDNAYLATARFETIETADMIPEMSLEHLQRLRFALDRALQPVEAFAGFERLDQFQTAALRYQINVLAYAIAVTQARFTPAFSGYMRDAQFNLLDKQTQKPVWSYWGLENLWGNLRLDDNPIGAENIMFTGFVALQMTLLRANDESDFAASGRFRLNGRLAFGEADFIDRLDSETRRSAYTLFACEPNWIYPLCNTIGASAIRMSDPERWATLADRFRAALDSEFLDAFGRLVPCRSARTGLALPAIGGVMPLAMPCFFLNAIAPDLATRQWLLLRRRLFDGHGQLRRRAFWPIDTGNYRFTRASAYAATALAAAELGDREVLEACHGALNDECPNVLVDGVIHRPRASVWAHGVELMALAGVMNGFRDLTTANASGPKIDGLPYPSVLVASAHSSDDGLRAVIHGNGRFPARLSGLEAGRVYQCAGAATRPVRAGASGEATIELRLDGRTELTVQGEVRSWRAA